MTSEPEGRPATSFLALLRASLVVSLGVLALVVVAWLGWRWFTDWYRR